MIKANVGLITQKEDGSEQVNYQNEDFPSYLHVGNVFPGASWINKPHYHEDLEFITITKGETGYNINGEKIYLKTGDTLMVNTNQVHYSFTTQQESCSDQVRLHDYYGAARSGASTVENRAGIYRAVMEGILIDTDGAGGGSRRDTMRYIRRAAEQGVPDLYSLHTP